MSDSQPGILHEYRTFLMSHRRWWLTCLGVLAVLIGALAYFGQANESPFLYTLY